MRKLFFLCLCLGSVFPVYAREQRHQFDIAYEFSDYKYEEPHMAHHMSLSGLKQGVSVVYTRQSILSDYLNPQDPSFGSLEIRYMTGQVAYNGWLRDKYAVYTPFQADHLTDYYFETVLKTGWRLDTARGLSFSPYLGVGYRYLRNHLEQASMGGYLRTSTYVYMPLGAQLKCSLSQPVSLALQGEFDWLLAGEQYSDLAGGIINSQQEGYGLRASVKLSVDGRSCGVFVEPFWRFWHLQNSDYVGTAGWYEPFNRTHEYGLRTGISF